MREPNERLLRIEDLIYPEYARYRNTPWKAGEPQWNWVTDQVATGGECRPNGDVHVAGRAFTHVLDCRGEYSDRARFARLAPHVTYGWIGREDDGAPSDPEWFAEGIAWALTALEDPDARILIHCAEGINRGPSMAYGVLRAQGYEADEALRLICSNRACAWVRYDQDFERLLDAGHLTSLGIQGKVLS